MLVSRGDDLVLRKEEDFVCNTFNEQFIGRGRELHQDTTYLSVFLLLSLGNTQTLFNIHTLITSSVLKKVNEILLVISPFRGMPWRHSNNTYFLLILSYSSIKERKQRGDWINALFLKGNTDKLIPSKAINFLFLLYNCSLSIYFTLPMATNED